MDTDPHIVPTVLAGLVIAVSVTWVLVLWVRNRPRRPRAMPATMDLGPEPPAVVDLLTDDFVVTPLAVPATLVDLAARRLLFIEDVGGGNVIIRLRGQARDAHVKPYERRVLDHLHGLAVDGLVPADAMTTGTEAASKNWWKSFRREVVADAQSMGLSRDRWTRTQLLPIWTGVVAAGLLLWAAMEFGETHDDIQTPGLEGLVWVVVALAAAVLGVWSAMVLKRDLQRDTDAGLDAASRWLGVREHMTSVGGGWKDKPAAMVALWDRYLAHAVALDLAPLVVEQLPLGAEDHRHAWSRAGGRWRPVRVRYPWLRPAYGQHPALALLAAAAGAAAAGYLLVFAIRVRRGQVDVLDGSSGGVGRGIDIGALATATLALTVVVWCAVKLVFAVIDLFSTDVREGVMLRTRVRRGWVGLTDNPSTSTGDTTKQRFFCALDTGAGPTVTAFRVRESIWSQIRQGGTYRVHVTPRLGYVRRVESVSGPQRS